MKNLFYIFLSIVLFAAMGCEEIPPDISAPGGGGGGTSVNDDLADQPRQAIIEEFTGVTCVNCPNGSAQIETMLESFGGQLIAVSIHTGSFAVPATASTYDFRTDDGAAVLDYLGQPLGFPTAVVDRKLFDGENNLQIFQSTWNGHVDAQLAEEPKIRLGIEADFNAANRAVAIDLTFLPAEVLDNSNLRYTVMITENNIVDFQVTPDGNVDDYVHKHVFRDIITTNFDGDPITEDILPNVPFQKSLNYTLPSEWDENECSIIAFVNYSGDTKEILQANEVHLVE